MGNKPTRQKAFRPTDYDQPTEPMERIVLPPSTWHADGQNMPPSQTEARPYPQEYTPTPPSSTTPIYPVLPPAPHKQQRGPFSGGASSEYRPLHIRPRRRSPVPGLVGLGFMLVQLVLFARVVCLLLGVTATTLWWRVLFLVSDVCVEPVRWLATTINVAPLAGTQSLTYLEFLLAILAYGIVARILVGMLKFVLRR